MSQNINFVTYNGKNIDILLKCIKTSLLAVLFQ